MARATVVGGGISGAACSAVLAEAGIDTRLRDRGRRFGGRMASRMLRDTGTPFDGRVVDIGASYFTAAQPDFVATVERLTASGVVRPWTTSFHVVGPSGIEGVKTGPMRYAAPGGLRTVVEALVDDRVAASSDDPVGAVVVGERLTVDGDEVDAIALCLPHPQAERVFAGLPASTHVWEPVVAVTLVFDRRRWIELDGVFVNDDPVLTWIADDGSRRGDGAPVLVAHVNPVLAAMHLDDPATVIPHALAAVRRVLDIDEHPDWVDAHRWTYARPLSASADPCWLHDALPIGAAGDAWAGGPRVEAAWLSGHGLGEALVERLGSAG